MCPKRARLVPWLMGLVLAAAAGCATSVPAGNGGDSGVASDGGSKTDRGVQQDAPPFDQDATPEQDDAGVQDDGPPQLDGQLDGPHDAQHDATVQQDASVADGGCTADPGEPNGNTCTTAIDEGSLTDATSTHLVITGNIWPAGDVDWYKITFIDDPDDNGVCDKYNARIAFTATGNPGNAYAFDVLMNDCATSPVCGTTGDSNLATTEFHWDDSGECPCYADPVNTLPGYQVCVDHSMVLRIRVFRVSGTPVCESYQLALDNG